MELQQGVGPQRMDTNKQKHREQQAHIWWQHIYSSELWARNLSVILLSMSADNVSRCESACVYNIMVLEARFVAWTTFTFSRRFCLKRLTVIHTLMVVAAMQGADQRIRSSWFSILPKDTSTWRPGESNQRPSYNKTLALHLSCSYHRSSIEYCGSCLHFVTIPK